ncbi:MAG: VOC family protein [Thermoleophilia bacterium]|nr:VOC family protein [Thermoleophilia bacterium]
MLGGEAVLVGEPTIVQLANGWVTINVAGGPTDDKPGVVLETPPDPNRVSAFLNIRVADIAAVYEAWSARGAEFLTAPVQHAAEIRAYLRDPDGHLIEVGQLTEPPGQRRRWAARRRAPQRGSAPARPRRGWRRTGEGVPGLRAREKRDLAPRWRGGTAQLAPYVIATPQATLVAGGSNRRGAGSGRVLARPETECAADRHPGSLRYRPGTRSSDVDQSSSVLVKGGQRVDGPSPHLEPHL